MAPEPGGEAVAAAGALVMGAYELLKPIGKGKFAVVYRARHVETDDLVALKKIGVDSMDHKAREKCLKEVRLLQTLEHANIIRYINSSIEGDELIIVFEWAAAGDLKRQIRKAIERATPFEERVVWKYFSGVCDALQHMHERRILHRDLKPANVFLTLNGTVKVGDLGLGRAMSEATLEAHSKVGTPLYMSPEVLRGDGYDWKSDVWSLGCILYELAALRSPFKSEGLNLYSLFQKISKGDFEAISDAFSPTLRDLAHSALSVDPAARPDVNACCAVATRMRRETMSAAAAVRAEQAAASTSSGSGDAAARPAAPRARADAQKPQDQVVAIPSSPVRKPSQLIKKAATFEARPNSIEMLAPSGPAGKQMDSAEVPHDVLDAAEAVHDKLKALGISPRLPKTHFAMEGGGRRAPRATQFRDFVRTASALLDVSSGAREISSGARAEWQLGEMAPATSVKNMLKSIVQVGFPAHLAGAVNPHDLTRGFGRGVVDVLDWLCDAALSRVDIGRPKFEPFEDGAAAPRANAADAMDDEASVCDDDFFEAGEAGASTLFAEAAEASQSEGWTGRRRQILGHVDEAAWALELERVSPRLASRNAPREDWRGRCHGAVVNARLVSGGELVRRLAGVSRRGGDAADACANLSASEDRLSATYEAEGRRYGGLSAELAAVEAFEKALRVSVSHKSELLSVAEAASDDLAETTEDLNSQVTDSSKLASLRRALASLRAETADLDVQIGIARLRLVLKQKVTLKQKEDRQRRGPSDDFVDS